ncbi:MAG: tetratricopeptide repeat protein [bacterium]
MAEKDDIFQRINAIEKDITDSSPIEDLKSLGDLYLFLFDIENDPMHLDKAVHYLSTAVLQDPDDARIHANLGLALMERGSPTEAMTALEKAISTPAPDNKPYIVAHYLLGKIFMNLGKPLDAIKHLNEAHTLDTTNFDIWNDLAVAHAKAGNNREAEYILRRILEEDPENPLALDNMSRLTELPEDAP